MIVTEAGTSRCSRSDASCMPSTSPPSRYAPAASFTAPDRPLRRRCFFCTASAARRGRGGRKRDAFARSYRVFVWEARGHGSATPVTDAGLSDYYADAQEALAAVVEQAGRPAVVVAHSMGGLLAFALAKAHPDAVRALFLIDPVYATGEEYGHFSPRAGAVAKFLCTPLLRSFARGGTLSRIVARWVFSRSFEDRARMEAAWRGAALADSIRISAHAR